MTTAALPSGALLTAKLRVARARRLAPRPVERPAWVDVLAAGDAKRSRIGRAFKAAVRAAQRSLDARALGLAFERRDAELAEFVVGFAIEDMRSRLRLPFRDAMLAALVAGAQAAARHARNRGGFKVAKKAAGSAISFSIPNPEAERWAAEASSRLVVEVTEETRAAIRTIIARSFSQSIPVAEVARQIRPLIGLTEASAEAVQNLVARILANPGGKVWAGGMGIRVPKSVTWDYLSKWSARYSAYLLNRRAISIARTEVIRAANEGQLQLWRKSVTEGWLRGDELKQWITTPDDRLCQECEAMEGEVVPLEQEFSSGDMVPPLHPQCRCTIGLAPAQVERPVA